MCALVTGVQTCALPIYNGGWPKGKKGSGIGRNILGHVINDVVGDAASKAGVYSSVPIAEVSGTLTDAIACRLDPGEHEQEAAATAEVTRSEEDRATAKWQVIGRK